MLLVAGAETAFALFLPVDRGRHEVDRLLAAAERGALAGEVLVLSDSVSYDALTGIPGTAGIADATSNRALSVAGNTFLVQRILARGAPDLSAVAYVAEPMTYEYDLDSKNYLASYFTSLFTRPEEIALVAKTLGRPDLVAAMEAARREVWLYPPSYLRRGFLLGPLTLRMRGLKRYLSSDVLPAEPTALALADYRLRRERAEFRPARTSSVFLPLLAELLAARGVRLVLIPAPVAPTLREAWDRNTFADQVRAWLQGLAATHPNMTVLDHCPLQTLEDRFFYDGSHLSAGPKQAWGEALARTLAGLVGR